MPRTQKHAIHPSRCVKTARFMQGEVHVRIIALCSKDTLPSCSSFRQIGRPREGK
jgi:hypothetical protein